MFLALTVADPESDVAAAVRARARHLFGVAVSGGHREVTWGSTTVLVADPIVLEVDARDARGAFLLTRDATTEGGERWDAAALLARVDRDGLGAVAAAIPPFGAGVRTGPDAPLTVVTDVLGLHHVYRCEGDGWGAASSSSRLLGGLARAGVDEGAVTSMALLGTFVGDETAYAGVEKLPARTACTLEAGRCPTRTYTPAPSPPSRTRRLGPAVDEGIDAVRASVGAVVDAHGGAGLELSGGLDSRMLLAAIPPPQRAGRLAVTLGAAGSAEWAVAGRLSALGGLEHRLVDLGALAALDPVDARARVEAAARSRDGGVNPVAAAVNDWADAEIGGVARLTGQNGEFARGFYYAGQRPHPAPERTLVESLARWRLFVNDAVDPAVFRPGVAARARERTTARIGDLLDGYRTDWLAATDELYLGQRMQRWVGGSYAHASSLRPILAPFFAAPFLTWSRALDPELRRGSRAFVAVLERLAPELAALPLDTGLRPTDLVRRTPRATARRGWQFASKLGRKVGQRVRRRDRPGVGAPVLAGAVRRAWSLDPTALAPLEALPFLDMAAVSAIANGDRPAAPATVGHLVDLLVLVDPATPG